MAKKQASRSAGQRAGLDTEIVLEKALQVAETEGVDQVTIRRLARELGVMPNAIYSYFPDKGSLLEAVVDSIYSEVLAADLTLNTWRETVLMVMDRLRQALIKHSQIVPLILSRSTVGPNSLRISEFCLRLLRHAGLNPEQAVAAFRTLTLYTIGFASVQTPRKEHPDLVGRSRSAAEVYMSVSSRDYPELRRHAHQMAKHPSDENFRRGLGWILDGIESHTH